MDDRTNETMNDKVNKNMNEKTNKNVDEITNNKNVIQKLKWLWATLTVLCGIGAVVIFVKPFFWQVVQNESGNTYWLDLDRNDIAFENTQIYSDMVMSDLRQLSDYLAICGLFETDGQFDDNKTIDVLAYAKRRGDFQDVDTKNLQLIYKVDDLISWSREDFEYQNGDSQNEILESSEDTTYEKEEKDSIHEKWMDAGMPANENELIVEVTQDEAVDTPNTEVVNREDNPNENRLIEGQPIENKLVEAYKPVNKASLYDLNLSKESDYLQIVEMLKSAANDLAINYEQYCDYRSGLNENLKKEGCVIRYMVVNAKDEVTASNLLADTFTTYEKDDVKKAFEKMPIYMIYNYEEDQIQTKGLNQVVNYEKKTLFRNYRYLMQNGEKLYVALLIPGNVENQNILGNIADDDSYTESFSSYKEFGSLYDNYRMGFLILSLGLVFLILFGMAQPALSIENLKAIDRWYVEPAIALFVIILFGMAYFSYTIGERLFSGLSLSAWRHMVSYIMYFDAVICMLLLLLGLGSLVRRIKSRTFLKSTILALLIRFLVKSVKKSGTGIKKGFVFLMEHTNVVVRTLIAYVLFLGMHFLLIAVFGKYGLVLVLIMDVLVFAYIVKDSVARTEIADGIQKICEGQFDYQIPEEKYMGENRILAKRVNDIGSSIYEAVETSNRDERLKAELITNVSHDIKTPLTSIINYVDLLKKENIEGENAQKYLRILDEKSQRLKQLTMDLVEASKITTGNITIENQVINIRELIVQAIGEYEEKLTNKNLKMVFNCLCMEDEATVLGDPRHMWRVFDNLLGNICKYAMEGTRVYIDVELKDKKAENKTENVSENKENNNTESSMQNKTVHIVIRNISATMLNIPPEELMQRFVRADESRSTQGSGLGLSIAQSLVRAQNGEMILEIDGDLFKVNLLFDRYEAGAKK